MTRSLPSWSLHSIRIGQIKNEGQVKKCSEENKQGDVIERNSPFLRRWYLSVDLMYEKEPAWKELGFMEDYLYIQCMITYVSIERCRKGLASEY